MPAAHPEPAGKQLITKQVNMINYKYCRFHLVSVGIRAVGGDDGVSSRQDSLFGCGLAAIPA